MSLRLFSLWGRGKKAGGGGTFEMAVKLAVKSSQLGS
jgi:hypothetical protein